MNELVEFNSEYNCGTTTSLQLAENFNRQHKTILAAINSLDVSQEFVEQNFLPYSYIAKNGKANPAYEITFDGFTLLAMGFTGKKAMEARLKMSSSCGEVTVKEHTRSLPSGKKEIVLSEKAKTEIGGIVKNCAAVAVREELAKAYDYDDALNNPQNIMQQLNAWFQYHHSKLIGDYEKLNYDYQILKLKLENIQKAIDA